MSFIQLCFDTDWRVNISHFLIINRKFMKNHLAPYYGKLGHDGEGFVLSFSQNKQMYISFRFSSSTSTQALWAQRPQSWRPTQDSNNVKKMLFTSWRYSFWAKCLAFCLFIAFFLRRGSLGFDVFPRLFQLIFIKSWGYYGCSSSAVLFPFSVRWTVCVVRR